MTLPEGSPVDLSFEQFTRRAELELQFIRALSEARAQEFKNASVEAHVVNQRLTNVTKSKSIAEFEHDIARFNAHRREQEVAIRNIQRHAQNLNFYKLGHRVAGIVRQNIWAAYKVFVMSASMDLLVGWSKRAFVIDQLHPDWFMLKTVGGQEWSVPNDASLKLLAIKNVGQMIDWQLEYHEKCSVVFGSPPHVETCLAFAELCNSAKADVAAFEKSLAELRAGILDLWKPQKLIKLVDSPVS